MKRRNPQSAIRNRPGFTLVEMLVAVALVMLMMVLFAEVFSLAASALSTQRGIAENDQRARTLTTLIKGDLGKRTFRNVVPFYPGEPTDASQAPTSYENRGGYFYISENNLNSDTDDVLQFTVRSDILTQDKDETQYFGRAQTLSGNFLSNPNQPDRDDGISIPDQTADSTAAEVCYFMRAGNLYRRVMLIREPLPQVSGSNRQQPQTANGQDYFDPSNNLYSGVFWRDFDFSAHFQSGNGAQFHGLVDLNNRTQSFLTFALGNPQRRFGHNHTDGLPREFVDGPAGANTAFIGRFTHQETSHPFFNYPQAPSVDGSGNAINSGNPMNSGASANRLTLSNSVVSQYSGPTPRRGEDILLPNVHSLDVKIWDDRINGFVDVGHNQSITNPNTGQVEPGDYHINRRRNTSNSASHYYGPVSTVSRVFDTWNRQLDIGGEDEANPNNVAGPDNTPDHPPLRAMTYYPTSAAASPPLPPGFSHSAPTRPVWQSNTQYNAGNIVFPIPPSATPPTTDDSNVSGNAFYFEVVSTQGNGNSGPGPIDPFPERPRDGQRIVETNPNGQITWQAHYNLRPLRAIQVTIRFQDVSTGQLRQLTLVHSLRD